MEETMGRATDLLVGALLLLTLGGCGADGSTTDPSAGTTQAGADTRARLEAGLATVSPTDAEFVGDAQTTLTPVDATWLRGWQVFDVEWRSQHPRRFYAALSDDGTALVLSGSPDSFAQMVRNAHVVVDDASVATLVGTVYLDVTRDFSRWSYRINSLSEVKWRPDIDSDVSMQQQRADLEAQYGALIQPPTAESSGTGWNVSVWMVYDRSLVRHNLTVGADGVVQDSSDVVATDMPVPYSI